MSHSNLSPVLHKIVDHASSQPALRLGVVLRVYAMDAKTRRNGSFRIQVVGFTEASDDSVAIYQFLRQSRPFSFFGEDRKTPITVRAGSLAGAGVNAIHIPKFVLHMIGFGPISSGHDYSFEYVGGKNSAVYAHQISNIEYFNCPERWSAPIKDVERYLRMVEAVRKENQRRKEQRAERLKREVTIRTLNTTYHFFPAEENDERNFECNGLLQPEKIKLLSAYTGSGFCAEIFTGGGRILMESSSVISIEPDPDAL